jgi:hypothetical protein
MNSEQYCPTPPISHVQAKSHTKVRAPHANMKVFFNKCIHWAIVPGKVLLSSAVLCIVHLEVIERVSLLPMQGCPHLKVLGAPRSVQELLWESSTVLLQTIGRFVYLGSADEFLSVGLVPAVPYELSSLLLRFSWV